MSNADRFKVGFIPEASYGVTPSVNAQELRCTAFSLAQNTTTAQSTEIRSDRQVSDVIRTDVEAAGDLSIEFSYDTYDVLMQQALQSAPWSAAVTLINAVSAEFTASSGSIAATGVGSGATVGRWVKVSGTANNNGFYKILEVVGANEIIVDGGAALVNETAADTIVVMGGQIVNGTAQQSGTFTTEFTDLAATFGTFPGSVIGGLNLTIPPDGIVTGAFNVLAQKEISATTLAGSGTYDAASTTRVMNGIDNVPLLLEGDLAVSANEVAELTAFSFQVQNNLRARKVIGTLGAKSIGSGKFAASGSTEAFFSLKADYEKYLEFQETAIASVLQDAAGNAYVIEFPRVKFTTGSRTPTGENTDITMPRDFAAYRHETEGVTMRIVRFPVTP